MRAERRGEEREAGRGQRDADPLAPRDVVVEDAVGEHRHEHEPAGDHRLHDRDRRERERRDVEAPRRRRDDAADRVDRRAEQRDRARERPAPLDGRRGDRPAMLEQEAEHRHERGDEGQQQAELDGERQAGKRTSRRRRAYYIARPCPAPSRSPSPALVDPRHPRDRRCRQAPVLRLARRLLRDRLPAQRRRASRPTPATASPTSSPAWRASGATTSSSSTSAAAARRPSRCCSRRSAAPARARAAAATGGRTQIAAAERFLRRNRGEVGLVTVSIGGNDVTACARAADPIPCVVTAVQAIEENVTEIAERLREAAGRKVRIVGITYPDVILGQWVGAEREPGPRAALRHRVQGLHQPGAEARLRGAWAASSSTSRRRAAPTARSTRRPTGCRRTGRSRCRSRRSASYTLLLRVPRHPRAHERLPADRPAGREDAAAPMTRTSTSCRRSTRTSAPRSGSSRASGSRRARPRSTRPTSTRGTSAACSPSRTCSRCRSTRSTAAPAPAR